MPEPSALRRGLAILIGCPFPPPGPREAEQERTGDEEMWQIVVWVKPGRSGEVCDQLADLDGVAEVYRAYRTDSRA